MIGSTIGAFVLLAMLSTFLFLGRSGANIQNYIDMESQARKSLELFAEDTRQATAISWASSTNVTLTVDGASVVYYYDSAAKSFKRTAAGTTTILISGITTFSFKAYNITGTEITDFSTAAALTSAGKATKQLQVSLESSRTSTTVVSATNSVLSARFILRNKRVTT